MRVPIPAGAFSAPKNMPHGFLCSRIAVLVKLRLRVRRLRREIPSPHLPIRRDGGRNGYGIQRQRGQLGFHNRCRPFGGILRAQGKVGLRKVLRMPPTPGSANGSRNLNRRRHAACHRRTPNNLTLRAAIEQGEYRTVRRKFEKK